MRQQFQSAVLMGFLHLVLFLALARAQPLDVIQLGSTSYYVLENAGPVAIQLVRSGPMTDYASLHLRTELRTVSGSSAGTNDFQMFSRTVTFAPGQSNLTVSVEIINDALAEGHEYFDVIISDPDPFCCQLGSRTRALVEIQDNDRGVYFERYSYSVYENVGELLINVFRVGDMTNRAGSIRFQVQEETAGRNSDFTIGTNRVSFSEGQTNATITVSIVNDAVPESWESFRLWFELTPDPLCCSVAGQNNTTIYIYDNDRGVEFSRSFVYVREDAGAVEFVLWREGEQIAEEGYVTLKVLTNTSTRAVPDVDFASPTNLVVYFAAGQSNATFSVTILNDALVENQESFTLSIRQDASTLTLGRYQTDTSVYIVDNDLGVEFAPSYYQVREGERPGEPTGIEISVRRVGDPTNEFSVELEMGGTASAGADFILPTNRLFFPSGASNTVSLVIPVLDDPLVEGTEVLDLYLTNATGGVPVGRQSMSQLNFYDNEYPVNMADPAFNSESFRSGITGALMQPDGKVLIVTSGYYRRGVLKRLHADGSHDLSFRAFEVSGTIKALAVQADGKILCAGDFSWSEDGTSRRYLVRLAADGLMDWDFVADIGLYSDIECLQILPDGKILIGGIVRHSGSWFGAARLSEFGAWDDAFGLVIGPSVSVMVVQPDGRIVIGGAFNFIGDQARYRLARLFSDGSVDSSFPASPATNASLSALILQTDGNLVAVVSSRQVVRLLGSDGAVDSSFQAPLGTNSTIANLSVQPDGKVLLQGEIFGADNQRLGGIVRLNVDGSLDRSFISVFGQAFVAWVDGHVFTSYGDRIVRLLPELPLLSLSLSSNKLQVFENGTNVAVSVLRGGNSSSTLSVDFATTGEATFGLDFIPGYGTVTFQPLETIKEIVFQPVDDCRLETNEATQIALSNPSAGAVSYPARATLLIVDNEAPGSLDAFNPPISAGAAALQPDGKIVIGGSEGFVRLNQDGSEDKSFVRADPICSPDPDCGYVYCGVYALVVQPDGKILAGGEGQVIRLHPNGMLDTNFVMSPICCSGGPHGGGSSGAVRRLLLQPDGKVLVSDSCGGLRMLNVDGTVDRSIELGAFGPAAALQGDGKLLLAGFLGYDSGTNSLIRVYLDGTRDTNFFVRVGGPEDWRTFVHAIAMLPSERILIAGDFTFINHQARSHLARINPNGSLDENFDPLIVVEGSVMVSARAITVAKDGYIFLGGEFSDGTFRVVKLDSEGSVISTFNSGLRFSGSMNSIIEQPHDGKVLVSGNFSSVNGIPRPGIARLVSERSHMQLSPPVRQANGSLRITSGSHVGNMYVLQSSGDLIAWRNLSTNVADDCTMEFKDPSPGSAGFYRVVKLEQ